MMQQATRRRPAHGLPVSSNEHEDTPQRGARRRPRGTNSVSPVRILLIMLVGSVLIFVCAEQFRLLRRRKQRIGNLVKDLKVGVKEEVPNAIELPHKETVPKERAVDPKPIVPKPIGNAHHHSTDDEDTDPAFGKQVNSPDEKSPDENTDPADSVESDESIDAVAKSDVADEKVLALLYPPGLMGGYRNQVIRLLSLCVHAQQKHIPSLLLPSLLWSTQVIVDENGTEAWVPIPHDLIFDVDHWNSEIKTLPKLIDESYGSSDCWTHDFAMPSNPTTLLQREVLKRGFLTPITDTAMQITTRSFVTNLRKLDLYENVSSCSSPIIYGGGKMAGRLWRDYTNAQNKGTDYGKQNAELLQSLRPKQEWRDLAQSCVSDHMQHSGEHYIALHARMELEMMDHACGRYMQRNLTTLFSQTAELASSLSAKGMFVAVSRSGIDMKEGALYDKFQEIADDNLNTFNQVVGDEANGVQGHGLLGEGEETKIVVFECGKLLMDKYYATMPAETIDYGSLLQSVVNFYIATESKAFVGVRGSSYSTDIWTTRYHLGKGDSNYEYTQNDGIILLDNDGLPPMHTNCKRKTS